MEHVQEDFADKRAHTDASLDAERANADATDGRTTPRTRRMLDDLIEGDRLRADERLVRSRNRADAMLARERSASFARDRAVAIERDATDDGKKTERHVMDALLEQERGRADAVVEAERQRHEDGSLRLEARRLDTDAQLSRERSGADGVVDALGDTKSTLARTRSAQAHKDNVFAMVTHDLRSPLFIIDLNARSIADGTKEPATREAIEDVVCATARMQRLLTDLLDVARIESGTLRMVKRRQDVGELVAEILRSYRPLFADRGMTFTAEGPATPLVASFDHDRIVQVLSNLLCNAMKFTPSGGSVSLHVELRGEQIEFTVKDTGPGIHPDARPHVFERFWQVDNDARRGLGLGLYICEKIVTDHGGRIGVESDFGKGATFRFTLPAG